MKKIFLILVLIFLQACEEKYASTDGGVIYAIEEEYIGEAWISADTCSAKNFQCFGRFGRSGPRYPMADVFLAEFSFIGSCKVPRVAVAGRPPSKYRPAVHNYYRSTTPHVRVSARIEKEDLAALRESGKIVFSVNECSSSAPIVGFLGVRKEQVNEITMTVPTEGVGDLIDLLPLLEAGKIPEQ